jgi:hypothetical protein
MRVVRITGVAEDNLAPVEDSKYRTSNSVQ